MSFTETLQSITGKLLADCTDQELYLALLELVRQKSADRVQPVTGRKLYYISAEFLIGKLLSNNLVNLGLYDEARSALAAAGKRLSDIEEVEPEPSLGNGGLGRLAACFLDSLATLNLPGDGVGLRYHFGLFHQSFEDGVQNEKPDPWLTAHSWAEKTDTTYPVELAGKEYTARLYKLAVTGYEGRTNTLNLFDLDTIDESIVHDGIAFDKTAIDKNLTLFLYPDDSDEAGRRLRVYQQYLMVSAGAQLILAECAARGCNFHDLADYAAIQINDTHPSMVIPELIRLLGERGIEFEEAVEIVTKTCAYTNHTILAEALEKWPRAYLDAVVPQLMPIIEKLDALARTRTYDGPNAKFENPAWNDCNVSINHIVVGEGITDIIPGVRDPHLLQIGDGGLIGLLPAHTQVQPQPLRHLTANGQQRIEGSHGLLEDHPHLLPPEGIALLGRERGELLSVELDAPGHHPAIVGKKVHDGQRGDALAAAGLAHHA